MQSIESIFTGIPAADIFNFTVWGIVFVILIFRFFASIKIVPTQAAYVVERLGKYNRTLGAGFHALIPFVDKVAYQLDLKELTVEDVMIHRKNIRMLNADTEPRQLVTKALASPHTRLPLYRGEKEEIANITEGANRKTRQNRSGLIFQRCLTSRGASL